MNFKVLTLATSSLVALGLSAASAQAAGMMGDVRLSMGYNWTDFNLGGEGFGPFSGGKFDGQYSSFSGGGRVNLPYSDVVNIQLDLNADASLDQSFANGDGVASADNSAVSFGGHVNYRDQTGLLGVFVGSGRVHDVLFGAPIFMAGLEGQYYLPDWTLSAQVGYLDSDLSILLQNAGYVRAGATYYASNKLKLTASVAYANGENNLITNPSIDVSEWAWSVGVHYWFGKSIPVSGFLEYKGRQENLDRGSVSADSGADSVSAGLTFHFGGDGFKDAERTGAAVDLPDTDLFQLLPTAGALNN